MSESTFDLAQAILNNSDLKPGPSAAIAASPLREAVIARPRKRPSPAVARRVVVTRAEPVPIAKDKAVQRYQYWGLIGALLVLECLWIALWVLNGYLSVTFLGQYLQLAVVPAMLVHIAVSLCEQHLPRVKAIMLRHKMQEIWRMFRWVIWPLLFVITLFDVLSSAAGLQWYSAGKGWAFQGYIVAIFTILGGLIALGSERLIVLTGVVITRLVKR